MSTFALIAKMPGSCALMDAKSGKSLFVTGLGCGIDLNFGTDPKVMDEQITPGQKQPKHCPSWLVAAECCLTAALDYFAGPPGST